MRMSVEELFPKTDTTWHERATKRFASPFVGVPYDRIDIDPIVLAHAAVLCGYGIRDFYEKPELGIATVAYINELYDLLPVTHWFYSNVWLPELGATVKCTKTLPWIVQEPRPIQNPEDIDKLPVPDVDEVSKGFTFSLYSRAYDYAKKNLPNMFVPIHYVFCLYAMAAELVGPDKFIMWTIRQPKLCHKLLKKVADTSVNGAIATANKYGFALMIMGGVLANSTVLRPQQIKEFAIDYHRYLVRKALKGGAGPQLWYHLCGDHSGDYQLWKDAYYTPFTVMHIGYHGREVFPADLLVKEFGNLATVMSSVDTKLLNFGPPSAVYEQSKKQLLPLKEAPRGAVLGAACEAPPNMPPSSILAMLKASRDHGKYA